MTNMPEDAHSPTTGSDTSESSAGESEPTDGAADALPIEVGHIPHPRVLILTTAREALIDVAPLLIVFFILRFSGVVDWKALCIATVGYLAQTIFKLTRKQKPNPIALLTVAFALLAILVGYLTKDAQTIQLCNTIPSMIFVGVIFGSLLLKKPITKFAVEKLVKGFTASDLSARGWAESRIHQWNSMHRTTTLLSGIGALAVVIIEVTIVLNVSVDIAQILVNIVPQVLNMSLIYIVISRLRTFVNHA